MTLFSHPALGQPLNQRDAFGLYADLATFLSERPSPVKDPELGSKHGGVDAAWAKRKRAA